MGNWLYLVYLGLVLVAVGFFYFSSVMAIGFIFSALMGLFLLGVGIISLLLIAASFVRRNIAGILLVALAAGAFFMVRGMAFERRKHLHEFSQIDGNRVFSAIQEYRSTKGRLPETLQDLIPDHLKSIPAPAFQHSGFHYIPNAQKDTFQLWYDAPAWQLCHRDASGTWMCGE
jgi:hypothetical protein